MQDKFKKYLKALLLPCFILGLFLSGSSLKNNSTAFAEGESISLNNGVYERWIDRIDLTNATYANDFYDWLVENTNNDGEEDELIDVVLNEHEIVTIDGTFTVDVGQGNLEDVVNQELTRVANENFAKISNYSSLVFACFNRDCNEVFWLKRELRTLSSVTCSYNSLGEVTFSQKITMLIKNDNPDDDIPDYDVRLNVYKNGTLNLKNEINAVNLAIENILKDIDLEASSYEKVKYFNKWLTENNCYAKIVGEYNRDIRGAILGQEGNSQYAPVCEGYARAFKVLCDRARIPCVLSSGLADGEDHMWNLVQLEDGKWYAVDVTWNDPTVSGVTAKASGMENEKFLLVGADAYVEDKRFSVSHVEINKLYADKIAFNNGPSLNAKSYVAPIVKSTWNVSKTAQDSVMASLYQLDDHTPAKPSYKLIISGYGEMIEYSDVDYYPWKFHATYIYDIEIRSGVTKVKGAAFNNCSQLKSVTVYGDLDFGDKVFPNLEIAFRCHSNYGCYQKAQGLGFNLLSLCQIEQWQTFSKESCVDDEILSGSCACGYFATKTGKTAKGHDYKKELSFDDASHWKECKSCGNKDGLQNHQMSDWTIEKEATTKEKGLKTRACDCGYEEEAEIEKTKGINSLFEKFRSYIILIGYGIGGLIVLILALKILRILI